MLDVIAVSVAFVLLVLIFWGFQMRSGFLSTRYYLQIGSLALIGAASLYLAARALMLWMGLATLALAGVLIAVAVYHLALCFFKLTAESDSRYRGQRKADRALVGYDSPHERFTLHTRDGVRLQAISLTSGVATSEKAVIVCHGAGRSKNTVPVVQTCELLATKYHVFTFDFRGHMESGGYFTADGDTEADLQAMIEYIDKAGYKKIAVVGWSIGAWTALLSAAKGRHIDAIVAGSPPPINIETIGQVTLLRRLLLIRLPILGGVAVMRNMRTRVGNYVVRINDFVRLVPKIPVLLVYNDTDRYTGAGADKFEQLFDQLSAIKERLVLPGKGHLFDWPNTFFLLTKVFDWLEHNF